MIWTVIATIWLAANLAAYTLVRGGTRKPWPQPCKPDCPFCELKELR